MHLSMGKLSTLLVGLAMAGAVLGGKTSSSSKCQEKSLTTASGLKAPSGRLFVIVLDNTVHAFAFD